MDRNFYIELANSGLKMPMGTDLVLHEEPDPEGIRVDGKRLGAVMIKAAERYQTPLAVPQMDLTLEKEALLALLGEDPGNEGYHFSEQPSAEALQSFENGLSQKFTPAVEANIEAIGIVASTTDLVPLGMCIGPFSLMTKMLADPITPVTYAGMGMTGEDDAEVGLMQTALDLSTRLVLEIIRRQVEAGAKLMVIAEPATNRVFFSPKQIRKGSDVFERYAMAPNRQIAELLRSMGAELFFHCCGELIDEMLVAFGTLEPAVLSLGSSRVLWEDAALVPKSTILYGNLPSKKFYSETLLTRDDVAHQAHELIERMRDTGHPFILGTECDVLHVPGCEHTIKSRVDAILEAD